MPSRAASPCASLNSERLLNGLESSGKLIEHDAEGNDDLPLIHPHQFTGDGRGPEFVYRAGSIPALRDSAGGRGGDAGGKVVAQYHRGEKLFAPGIVPIPPR